MTWILLLGVLLPPQSTYPIKPSEDGRYEKLLSQSLPFRRNPMNYLNKANQMGGGTDTEEAVSWALEALAKGQTLDGSWDPPTEGSRREVTSLAVLAYLGGGWTSWDQETLPISRGWRWALASAEPRSAPSYHRVLRRGLSYLLSQQAADGFIGEREGAHSLRDHAVGAAALCDAYAWSGLAILRQPAELATQALVSEASSLTKSEPEAAGWAAQALRSATLAGLPFDRGTWDLLVPLLLGPSAGIPRKEAVDLSLWHQLRRSGRLPVLIQRNPPSRNLPSGDLRDWYWGSVALAEEDGRDGPVWKPWNQRMKAELLSMKKLDAESLAFRALALETYYRDNVFGLK